MKTKIKTKSNKNTNNFFIKLTQKEGISLVTLTITIIVIIILSAAVVITLNNNNSLTSAGDARRENDRDTMQSYLEMAMQKAVMKHKSKLALDTGKVTMDKTSNVKDTKGIITWESSGIKNLTGEIIFDKGTDSDTTFYTGYKLPVYGSETKWYVDENDKLVLQVGNKIYGANEVPKPGITASKVSKNPQKYYGAYVDYTTTNTLSENYKWRIFYATNSNIFLIASDYISVDDLPTTAKGNKPANTYTNLHKTAPFNNIINDYTGSASITEDMKWFNKDYFDKGYSSTNKNMKAVAYLLDKTIWTDKFKGNWADYVVGGPSLDMVLSSYNQFTNQSNVYQAKATNVTGYQLSCDCGTNWKDYMQDSSKYLTQGDTLYKISSKNNASAYWVSSPSAYNTTYVMLVYYSGDVGYHNCNYAYYGFRPVVCLKSGISLKEIKFGKYYQI